MKALVLRAVLLNRRRFAPEESTPLEYRHHLERELTAILALHPTGTAGTCENATKIRNGLPDHDGMIAGEGIDVKLLAALSPSQPPVFDDSGHRARFLVGALALRRCARGRASKAASER